MTKSTITTTTTTGKAGGAVLNFTVKSSGARTSGATTATWNAKLRRMSLPSAYCKGVKAYELLGAEGGVDALMLTPCGAGAGRAVHPSQHFITVPSDLASALASRVYAIAGEAGGVLTLTPSGATGAKAENDA